jgi:hypothetical protein
MYVIPGQLFPELTVEERLYGWFQRLYVRISMHALSDVSGERIISSGISPARSPDLNTCNFSFCVV